MILPTLTILTSLSILVLGMAFLPSPFIFNEIYGLKPGDPGYKQYSHPNGTPNTPYEDMIMNGCLTKPYTGQEKTVILDTDGLVELGLDYFDPNTCFEIAKTMAGHYNIDDVKVYANDHMIITLTKKQ